MSANNPEKQVLVFFTQNPYPGKTGTHRRCLAAIDSFLAMDFQITLLSYIQYGPFVWNNDSLEFFSRKGVRVELYRPSDADRRFASESWAKNPDTLNLDAHSPPGLVNQFRTLYQQLKPEVLFIIYAYSSGLVSGMDISKSINIIDSNDLVSLSGQLIEVLNTALGSPPYDPRSVHPAIVQEDFFLNLDLHPNITEFSLYDLYDCTLAISESEAALIKYNAKATQVDYLPITFSPVFLNNSYSAGPVFIAADNPFNIQAYLFLASRIVPLLLHQLPHLTIDVIGEVTRKLVAVPGIRLSGFVENLAGIYEHAGFALCPIIGGTGMSVKVVEAMAHGLPVVVLRNATQDTVVTHGVNGFIANNAKEFAAFTLMLCNDRLLCSRLGGAARKTVGYLFSNQVFVDTLTRILADQHKKKKDFIPVPVAQRHDRYSGKISRQRLKVIFDISVLGLAQCEPSSRTGVFRVVEHLARGLAESPEVELHFCSTQHVSESAPQTQSACLDYLLVHPEFAKIPFHLGELPSSDIFHSPFHALPASVPASVRVLTVYDLIAVLQPHFFQGRYNPVPKILASLADQDEAICISSCTREDLCRTVNIDPARTIVVHLAADHNLFYVCTDLKKIEAVRKKYNIGQAPYILSLCTLEPRKNIDHLLRAFARLVRGGDISNTRLVLTGTKGWDFDRIFSEIDNNPELHKRIVLTGYVPDEELAPLYSGAQVFVYMSLYEGFGLPPLEAMQCGTPVITSNTSSLPEVVGDAGIMLDPRDTDGLCHALVRMTSDLELRDDLAQRALKRAALFSWERCVQETIAAYRKALAAAQPLSAQKNERTIVIDGVIFQLQHGRPFGISRLWLSMLTELGKLPIGRRIILLDRAGTAPDVPGIRKRNFGAYTIGTAQDEATILNGLCTEEQADLFLSTYYTFATATPSLLMLYDMIPERFDTVGPAAPNPEWRDKYHAVMRATAFAAISASTARDLATYYPAVATRPLAVVPCAVSDVFRTHSAEEITAFRAASGIGKPYFLLVGRRDQHKNVALFFRAFAKLANRSDYALVMAGNTQPLEPDLRELAGGAEGYAGFFTDEALSLVYSGAVALIYPSRYEGFGLPILEAMQSGCPVITCQNSSIPEVAGSAALYVGEDNVDEMLQAVQAVQQPEVREYLVKRGLQRAACFSWQDSAARLVQFIEEIGRHHV